MKEGGEYKITPGGSLGLLALGYRGVVAWRKVRDEALEKARQDKPGREK